MFTSIRIEGYRGLEHFEMSGLGRVNLLVGTNNSGKTSVLEAIYLLSSAGDPNVLAQVLRRRRERLPVREADPRIPGRTELDLSHIFTGHELRLGSRCEFSARNGGRRFLSLSIAEASSADQDEMSASDEQAGLGLRLVLEVGGNSKMPQESIPLTRNGGLRAYSPGIGALRVRQQHSDTRSNFITTESLTGDDLVGMCNLIALTPVEDFVVRALQFLDPDIERIAAQSSAENQSRGGFIVKRKGSDQPIPIGSMGDGMWRMLAMAIAITQSRGGVLLVDEIDTGLHYSVMSRMWDLVYNAASELDVQVFATTHSYDCVYSLAQICSTDDRRGAVTVQRIEQGKQYAVPYDETEISVAAARDIEVR